MKSSRALRNASAGLAAAVLALGLGTSPASATNVLEPILLSFNDLPGPGFWAPDSQDCQGYTYQGVFRYTYGARSAIETCFDNSDEDIVDETLGLWPTHDAAEAAWHEWVVNDEGEQGVNRVKPHHTFSVPVVIDEDTSGGPAVVAWEMTAVKGRVLILLNYFAGPKVNPAITIFERALNKVPVLSSTPPPAPVAASAPDVHPWLLGISNMPAGWSTTAYSNPGRTGCWGPAPDLLSQHPGSSGTVGYQQSYTNRLGESLFRGPRPRRPGALGPLLRKI